MPEPEFDLYRALLPGQRSVVNIGYADGRPSVELFSTTELLLEAPNWHPTSGELILNGVGKLWSLSVEGGGGLRSLEIAGLPGVNNDHVLSPDPNFIYASANDFHIYEARLDGADPARKITQQDAQVARNFMHFLHGVSPDNKTLAFVGLGWDSTPRFDVPPDINEIFTVPTAGGPATQITTTYGGTDGSEYFPDGKWIYFNSEHFSGEGGNAQICRMREDGRGLEQLTFDDNVNWFPHFSPTGTHAVYLAFPPGTIGHPANLMVAIKVVSLSADPDGNQSAQSWREPIAEYELFGGQGSINVNSWAPDGSRFAYVSYPTT